MNIDIFTRAYIECLLWLCDEEEYVLSRSDFRLVEEDCEHFVKKAAKYLEGLDPAQCGHDFYLTRNGHGSGFWDRGYDKNITVMLCKICEDIGECYLGRGG